MPPAMTAAARLGMEERQFELTKFLMAEDPLAMVIRAQIYIEEELVAFITARVIWKTPFREAMPAALISR